MKKLTATLVLALFIAGMVNGQAFKKESLVGNLGFGFGWYSYGYSVSSIPAISLSVEKGVWDIEDVGVISLGGIAGIKSAHYNYAFYGYSDKWTWNDVIIAARSAIHPVFFDNDKVDLYGGIALGVRLETYKYTLVTNSLTGETTNYTDNSTNALIAIYAGGRYYFTDHFGVFGELGYGLGYLTLGVSYKLK